MKKIHYLTFISSVFLIIEKSHSYSCIEHDYLDWRLCDPGTHDNGVCQCHNIVIDGEGDGDCESVSNGKKWCYVVGELSSCQDIQISSNNTDFNWWGKTIYYSEEACRQSRPKRANFGNTEFLPGFEIRGHDIYLDRGGGGIDTPTPEACQAECQARPDFCDGWTYYDSVSPACYLKSGRFLLYGYEEDIDVTTTQGYFDDEGDNEVTTTKGYFEDERDNEVTTTEGYFEDERDNEVTTTEGYFEDERYNEVPTAEDCQADCQSKAEFCDGWSFHPGFCHLKSSVCCNQNKLLKENLTAISGFNCMKRSQKIVYVGISAYCWSTEDNDDCGSPCSWFTVMFYFAALPNLDFSATAGIGIIERPVEYKRKLFKYVNGRWRQSVVPE